MSYSRGAVFATTEKPWHNMLKVLALLTKTKADLY